MSSNPKESLEIMTSVLPNPGESNNKVINELEIPMGFAACRQQATLSENSNTITVVCDAYLTNKEKLQNEISEDNDASLIAELYRKYDLDVVKYLEGGFAFILWDNMKRHLILARDKWGLRPLFYAHDGKNFAAASNIKSLLQQPWTSKEINPLALQSILLTQTNYFPETFFRGIFKLDPGSFMVFKNDKLEKHAYRKIDWNINQSLDEKLAIQRLRTLLSNSVDRWTKDNCKYAALVSGGLDSSSMVALFTQNKKYAPTLFTTGYGPNDPEALFAGKIAEEFGAKHNFLQIKAQDITSVLPEIAWCLEEPFGVFNTIPLFTAMRKTAMEHDAVLLGDTADGLFAGSLRHKVLLSWIPLPKFIKSEFYYNSLLGIPTKKKTSMCLQAIYWSKEQFSRPQLEDPKYFNEYLYKMEQLFNNNTGSLLGDMLRFEIENELPNLVNALTNRLSEYNGIDARVPFVDDELIQFAVHLPDNLRIRLWKEKWILRQAMKNLLPRDIYSRPKFGQRLEYDLMLTEKLEILANQFLISDRFRKRGFFDFNTVKDSLKRRNGAPYLSKQAQQIWILILIEITARIFLDVKSTTCPANLQDLM
jgi:asparagine synthase (glutamine-hydrolysing)